MNGAISLLPQNALKAWKDTTSSPPSPHLLLRALASSSYYYYYYYYSKQHISLSKAFQPCIPEFPG
jgi:hypothetical protein